jgi:hypothetical protein
VLWLAARFELCGLSGCGGGGFGRSYSPRAVLVLLLLSGLAAAAGHVLGRPPRAPQRLAAAALLMVVVPVLGGVLIGARPDGYPRSVSPETRERELERQEERRG